MAVQPFIDLVAGLGLAAVVGALLVAVLKRNAELRRWRKFKDDLRGWAADLIESQNLHPKQLADNEWRAECERMLYDARFTPIEIQQILDLSIIVAKGITLDTLDQRRW